MHSPSVLFSDEQFVFFWLYFLQTSKFGEKISVLLQWVKLHISEDKNQDFHTFFRNYELNIVWLAEATLSSFFP